MALNPLHRDYNMTDPELCMFVSNLVGLMGRDSAEFTIKGVLPAAVTSLQTLGNAFEVLPDDVILQANVSIAVEDKNAARETLFIAAKNVYNRAFNKWGGKSARYRSFDCIGLINLDDYTFVFNCRRVHIQGTFYLTQLASEGLTLDILEALEDAAQTFEVTLNAVKASESVRDMNTEDRILKGNEIYALVSKYCEIGKQIWEDISEAKYNDYVIYRGGGGGGSVPSNPPGVPEIIITGTGIYFSEVDTATSYQMVYKLLADTEWSELYLGPYITEVAFNPGGNGTWNVRVRARNAAGYGNWSEERTITRGLQPPTIWEAVYNSSTHVVTVQWHAMPGGSSYDVYMSRVPLGNPPAAFTMVQNVSGEAYQHDVTEFNVTEHYYAITRAGTESSTLGNTVPVNIPAET